jgi:hypothetical protein
MTNNTAGGAALSMAKPLEPKLLLQPDLRRL